MNCRTTKKPRKQAYGDYSQRTPSYNIITRAVSKLFKAKDGSQSYHNVKRGQRVCTGLRAKYLELKKQCFEVQTEISKDIICAIKKRRRSLKKQKELADLKRNNTTAKRMKFSHKEVEYA